MKKILQTLTIVLLFSSVVNAQWIGTTGPYGGQVTFVNALGTKIFCGNSTVFTTADTNTWTLSNSGMTGSSNCFATRGANIFVGTGDYGMYISTDNGSTWNPINNGLTTSYAKDVFSIAISGTNIFIGTDAGVFLSTHDGG